LFPLTVSLFSAINKEKSEKGVSVGRPIETLIVSAHRETVRRIEPVIGDVAAAVRAASCELRPDDSIDAAGFRVEQAVFAAAG
jgi:hypothetical protein